MFVLVFAAVCVAGHASSKNEILELLLPLKLFADENKVRLSLNFSFYIFKSGFFIYMCVVFRVSVQNGTSKWSTVGSRRVRSAASHTSRAHGAFEARRRANVVFILFCFLLYFANNFL